MKLFPKEKIILTTNLPQDSVLEKINKAIEPERNIKTFGFTKRGKEFEGTVFSDSFRINRILTYRNSFLPIIIGNVYSTTSGSQINLNIKMEKFQFVIFIVWTILLGAFSLCSLFIFIMELFHSGQLTLWALVAPAMFLIGYLYILTNFKREMTSTKSFLITLVSAKETLKN